MLNTSQAKEFVRVAARMNGLVSILCTESEEAALRVCSESTSIVCKFFEADMDWRNEAAWRKYLIAFFEASIKRLKAV